MDVVINRQGHSVKIPLPFPATSLWWADPERARHISLGPIISLFLYFFLSSYLLLSLLLLPLSFSLPFFPPLFLLSKPGKLFLSLVWLPFPVSPPEGRWFWDWNSGGEESAVSASSSSWNHVLHQSFSGTQNKGVPVDNAKRTLWFPSTFVPHAFNSLRRRGECRAGFVDAWVPHSDIINSSFTNKKSLTCARHLHFICRTSHTPYISCLKESQSKGLASAWPCHQDQNPDLSDSNPTLSDGMYRSPPKCKGNPHVPVNRGLGAVVTLDEMEDPQFFKSCSSRDHPSLWLMLCICELIPDQGGHGTVSFYELGSDSSPEEAMVH